MTQHAEDDADADSFEGIVSASGGANGQISTPINDNPMDCWLLNSGRGHELRKEREDVNVWRTIREPHRPNSCSV